MASLVNFFFTIFCFSTGRWSINKIPFRWSISCWRHIDIISSASKWWIAPSTSWYSTKIFSARSTSPLKSITLRQPSSDIVDPLSLYLNISGDVQKSPNRKVFTYQFADKKGISQREFTIIGIEKIKINKNEIETIRIECPELDLRINISKEYNFMPVFISKTNGKSDFSLILVDFIHI